MAALDYESELDHLHSPFRRAAFRAGAYAFVAGSVLAFCIVLRLAELLSHAPLLNNRNELWLLAVAAALGTTAIFLSGRAYYRETLLVGRGRRRQSAALGSFILSLSVTLGVLIYLLCSQEWLSNWIRFALYRKFRL